MRIDHIAYRVKDRHKTVKFFREALNYKTADEFEIKLESVDTIILLNNFDLIA